MTAAQGVAAEYRTGYPRITSQTPYPLGYLSPTLIIPTFTVYPLSYNTLPGETFLFMVDAFILVVQWDNYNAQIKANYQN